MGKSLEGKFIVFELDSNHVEPGPALILFQLKNGRMEKAYDPRDHNVDLDYGVNGMIIKYLREKGTGEVYSLREKMPLPESVFGLELDFDDGIEWGSYRPLGMHYWKELFEKAGIGLKEFDYP